MVFPSGDQFAISGGGYHAVVTESGAALRALSYDGRALLDGFDETGTSFSGRGQVLMPWPNRIRDGKYSFAGREQQLGLTEPALHNASHGLVRWVAWTAEEHTDTSVSLVYRLMAQTGYPWTLDLHVLYDLSADGLTVTHTATNLAGSAAPYAAGFHPYLLVGGNGIDGLELTLPVHRHAVVDDQLIPVAEEPVAGTPYDFSRGRVIGSTVLDDAFTDLVRDPQGRATVVLREPDGPGVALWVDERHHWLQAFSADAPAAGGRRSLAVEPMTAPADAFNSGRDLVTLAPAGQAGDELSASWGLYAL